MDANLSQPLSVVIELIVHTANSSLHFDNRTTGKWQLFVKPENDLHIYTGWAKKLDHFW